MVFGQVDELVENTEADGKQRWTTVDDFNWLDTDKIVFTGGPSKMKI